MRFGGYQDADLLESRRGIEPSLILVDADFADVLDNAFSTGTSRAVRARFRTVSAIAVPRCI